MTKNAFTGQVLEFGEDDRRPASRIQVVALTHLSRMAAMPAYELLSKALPGCGKTSFAQLSKSQVIEVIRFAKALPRFHWSPEGEE